MVSETQSNKTSSSSNQGNTSSLKGPGHSDLKDTNFEYEDNEWDIGKSVEISFNATSSN